MHSLNPNVVDYGKIESKSEETIFADVDGTVVDAGDGELLTPSDDGKELLVDASFLPGKHAVCLKAFVNLELVEKLKLSDEVWLFTNMSGKPSTVLEREILCQWLKEQGVKIQGVIVPAERNWNTAIQTVGYIFGELQLLSPADLKTLVAELHPTNNKKVADTVILKSIMQKANMESIEELDEMVKRIVQQVYDFFLKDKELYSLLLEQSKAIKQQLTVEGRTLGISFATISALIATRVLEKAYFKENSEEKSEAAVLEEKFSGIYTTFANTLGEMTDYFDTKWRMNNLDKKHQRAVKATMLDDALTKTDNTRQAVVYDDSSDEVEGLLGYLESNPNLKDQITVVELQKNGEGPYKTRCAWMYKKEGENFIKNIQPVNILTPLGVMYFALVDINKWLIEHKEDNSRKDKELLKDFVKFMETNSNRIGETVYPVYDDKDKLKNDLLSYKVTRQHLFVEWVEDYRKRNNETVFDVLHGVADNKTSHKLPNFMLSLFPLEKDTKPQIKLKAFVGTFAYNLLSDENFVKSPVASDYYSNVLSIHPTNVLRYSRAFALSWEQPLIVVDGFLHCVINKGRNPECKEDGDVRNDLVGSLKDFIAYDNAYKNMDLKVFLEKPEVHDRIILSTMYRFDISDKKRASELVDGACKDFIHSQLAASHIKRPGK